MSGCLHVGSGYSSLLLELKASGYGANKGFPTNKNMSDEIHSTSGGVPQGQLSSEIVNRAREQCAQDLFSPN